MLSFYPNVRQFFSKTGALLLIACRQYGILPMPRRRSSVVEHTLGKGEVESPILSDGTTLINVVK